LLDVSTLEKYDSQKMYAVYDRWPEIARESFESEQSEVNFEGINHIVFAGMGGSGSIGDVIASILSKSKIHVNIVKGYVLPKTVDSNTLVIAISVSGNTAETMSVLDSANKLGSKIIAFSSGGKIQDYCTKNKIEHRIVTQYHSPRASFTSYLYTILNVLHSTFDINKQDINDSINELEKLNKSISSTNLTMGNPSLDLAKWISGIPIIYYPLGLQATAIRFKNSLQENAKTHVMAEDIIEACHNGIVSWEKSSNVHPILLEGADDHIKTKERWKVIKEYFEANHIDYREVFSIKGAVLSKLITLVYFLDYTTIYLAILSKIDPSPVSSIEFVKSRI